MNLSIPVYGEKMETENSQHLTGEFKIQMPVFDFWRFEVSKYCVN